MIIPTVLEKSATGERAYDLYSRLLKDRIIFLGEDVNEHSMNLCIMQMLFLDREDPHMPIEFYINSPGGSVVDRKTATISLNECFRLRLTEVRLL